MRQWNIVSNIPLIALSVFLALLLAETAARFIPPVGTATRKPITGSPTFEVPENPDLGYKLRGIPEGPSENQGTDFRNRKFNISKDVGRIRILVVGDSIAWGAGVYRGEDLSAQRC